MTQSEGVNYPTHQRIIQICRHLETASGPQTLNDLAALACWSPSHLQKQFRQILGVTPLQYRAAVQRQRAQQLLPEADSVTAGALDAGFDSMARFYARAVDMLGMQPSVYRAGGAGVTLAVSAVPVDHFGCVQVAASELGVCSVEFADSADDALSSLRQRFPFVRIEAGDAQFAQTVSVVTQLLQGHQHPKAACLPLDVRGTAFQEQVWRELRGTRCGTTLTYSELAQRIGRPKAHRAVASACAANSVALLIPCHRVVPSSPSASVGEYRWGAGRKQRLLRAELSDQRHPCTGT